MIKVHNIVDFLLDYYPLNLASNFDEGKIGLQFGSRNHEVKKVMIALDGSTAVIEEAINQNIDLLILHHPFMFTPMLSLNYDNPIQKKYQLVIQKQLNVFAMHTNFDVGSQGMNDCLANILNFEEIRMVTDEPVKDGFLRYGSVKPILFGKYIEEVKEKFGLEVVRYVGQLDKIITKVGIVGGAGGSDMYKAKSIGCDTFITGEIRHNQALDALDLGLSLIEVPHSIEGLFKKSVLLKLQTQFPNIEFVLSNCDSDPFKLK